MSTLEVVRVSPEYGPRLAELTFPAYRHLLDLKPKPRHRDEADRRVIQAHALAAVYDGRPVGLILLELPTTPGFRPEVLSLYVSRDFRGQGIGKLLLTAAEQELWRLGHGEVLAVYMTGKPSIPILEHLFARRGWSTPQQRMVTVRFNVADLDQAQWIHRYKPRPGYEIFSWMDLTSAERERIRQSDAATPWIAPDLAPWLHDAHGFEPITSVGIRYQGDVVGWLINHKLAEDTVRYTCSFIRPDLARLGGILPAYVASFERLKRFGFKQGMFVTPLHHAPMARFAVKWFGPWASFVGETRGTRKLLTETSVRDPAAVQRTPPEAIVYSPTHPTAVEAP
jgi:GNAT superfamily N-acetyltransferase